MSLISFYKVLYLSKGQVVNGAYTTEPQEYSELLNNLSKIENAGADGVIIFDLSRDDEEHESNIGVIKNAKRIVNIPIVTGGNIRRFEDVKKYLYAGSDYVFIDLDQDDIFKTLKESSRRFGKEKIFGFTKNVHVASGKVEKLNDHELSDLVDTIIFDPSNSIITPKVLLKDAVMPVVPIIEEDAICDELIKNKMIAGFAGKFVDSLGLNIYEYKQKIKEELGAEVNIFESSIAWKDFKTNEAGLVPVIVQDHKTDEVLMLAYMNEESFGRTLKSRKMTYWSRSRQEIWTKGETSGCYQYVKSLSIDCDNDTILAKVIQIGAACHTGSKSCFYRGLIDDNKPSTNPYKVFEDVYSIIADRKINPKEGSYTNYLFDKGIDKILKKVGEEATEIVIAAKNPNAEEIKYEVSDFLYHVMVLMVERGVTWDDITEELAKR